MEACHCRIIAEVTGPHGAPEFISNCRAYPEEAGRRPPRLLCWPARSVMAFTTARRGQPRSSGVVEPIPQGIASATLHNPDPGGMATLRIEPSSREVSGPRPCTEGSRSRSTSKSTPRCFQPYAGRVMKLWSGRATTSPRDSHCRDRSRQTPVQAQNDFSRDCAFNKAKSALDLARSRTHAPKTLFERQAFQLKDYQPDASPI